MVSDLAGTDPANAASHMNERPPNRLNIVDIIGGSLYMLDVVMGFTIGVRIRWRDKEALVMDGVLVAEFYVTKASAVLDTIASLPTIPLVC